MKLYTEEEVIRAIELSDGRTKEEILAGLTHIELPSKEEVKKQNPFVWGSHVFGTRDLLIWEQGVEWMLDKLKGGNK